MLGLLSLWLSLLGLLLSLRLVLLLRLDLSLRDGVVILAVAAAHQRQTSGADARAAGGREQTAARHALAAHPLPIV